VEGFIFSQKHLQSFIWKCKKCGKSNLIYFAVVAKEETQLKPLFRREGLNSEK